MKRYYVAGVSLLGLAALATAAIWLTRTQTVSAHCQVPCGIYDDQARIHQLEEDATTIAKAITEINALAGKHDAVILIRGGGSRSDSS